MQPQWHRVDNEDPNERFCYNVHPSKDFIGFAPTDISLLTGELIYCSNYDWATPLDSNDLGNTGGIFIWHVDENIIDKYYPDSVNATGHSPGVYLMEADGTQSIGVPVLQYDGTYFINQGYWGDPWYKGNTADTFYYNSFSDVSQPNARSNANIPSGIHIFNFDPDKAKMHFQVQTGLTGIPAAANFPQKLDGNPATNAIVTADIDSSGQDAIFLATPNSLLAWKHDGSKLIPNSDSIAVFASEPGIFLAPSIDTVSGKIFALSQHYNGSIDSIWLNCWLPISNGTRATQVFRTLISTGNTRSITVPAILGSTVFFAIDTNLYIYNESGNPVAKQSFASLPPIVSIAATDTPAVIVLDHSGAAITEWNTATGVINWTRSINLGGNTSLSVGDMRGDGQIEICATSANGNCAILDNKGNIIASPALKAPDGSLIENDPSACGILFDALNNGTKEFITAGSSHVFAQTAGDASMRFPATLPCQCNERLRHRLKRGNIYQRHGYPVSAFCARYIRLDPCIHR